MEITKILKRNINRIITEKDFWNKMNSGRKLRIKHGVDPTNSFLHLGHAVNYWKLREFQELGHKVVFLIGDFTALIGDPTGKLKARQELSQKDIEKNAEDYLIQATRILINKPEVLEIRRNSEWYGKMKLLEFMNLAKKITHSRLIERDMFQARIKKNEEIYIHEFLYPLLQGYDSAMIGSDLTIIGTDQLFNELIGRHYQVLLGQEPQVVATTIITPGLDDKEKMSKSLGNYVAILDSAREKFGKIMTLADKLIPQYFDVYTKLSQKEIKNIIKQKHFEAKKRLAFEIVKLYHGDIEAEKSKKYFEKTFSKKEIPEDAESIEGATNERWVDFLVRTGLIKTKGEVKRLIGGGGLNLNGHKIIKASGPISAGILKIGKHKFIKTVIK